MDLNVRPPDAHAIASLRAITYRITSTPTKSLLTIAGQISASIWNCKDVLSSTAENSKSSSEASSIVHRFRTTLTSLLQDRTVEGRWSAVVLTKAAIEAGGLSILSKANGWVKSLIAMLKRHSDPSTSRRLATILLTRIFQLTWPHQELVREITTPALPAFIAACLENAQRDGCGDAEVQVVLEAFCVLVPRHPTVFRTHKAQIKGFVVEILSSTSNYSAELKGHQQSAARLLVLLHHCAPKQGGTEAWIASWASTIETANQTCDMLFRSIVEEPQTDVRQRQPNMSSVEVGSNGQDTWLKPWTGIYAGSERLITLVNILKTHLETAFSGSVSIDVGLLVQLLSRILTLEAEADASRFNHQIAKDEREALFHVLPDVHAAALELVASLLRRFGKASMPFAQVLLELTLLAFRAERSNNSVRTVAYTAIDLMLDIIGPSLTPPEVAQLGPVIEACCIELCPTVTNTAHTDTSASTLATNSNSRAAAAFQPDLQQAAFTLLPAFVTKINPTIMPNKPRTLIERTAIATRHKKALVACVLNPMTKATGKMGSSLLPILAEIFPGEPEVEALLRPRMPPVVSQIDDATANNIDFEDAEEVSTLDQLQRDAAPYAFDMHRTSHAHDTNGSAAMRGEDEDLYSLTPPRERDQNADSIPHASLPSSNGTKRPADTELNENTQPSKRIRTSSVPTSPTRPEDRAAQLQLEIADALETHREGVEAGDVEVSPLDGVVAAAFEDMAKAGAKEEDGGRSDAGADVGNEGNGSEMPPPGDRMAAFAAVAAGAGDVRAARRMLADARPTTPLVDGGEVGSDDSDFEMPPLTLEPDTESEDDDEEKE